MAKRMKEKAARVEERREKRPYATAKHVRISPDKVRQQVFKTLNSAAANAEHNKGLSVDDLYVAEAYADQGPTLKRFQPVSKGRAHHILKRTSHITVILDTKEDK